MSLTLEQVQGIAHLARIEISESEAVTTQGHLNGIFRLIEQMQAVDTRGVEPMAHAQDLSQRLRDDTVTEEDRRAAFQAVAPEIEGGLYLVPKVIERSTPASGNFHRRWPRSRFPASNSPGSSSTASSA